MSNETKEVVELTFDKLEQYFEAAKGVIEQYGGDVAEVGLNVLRIEAISEIFFPLAVILFLFASLPLMIRFGKWINQKAIDDRSEPWEMIYIVHILLGIFFLIQLVSLLNLWAWVGIFYPELYAVHKFIL